MTATTRTHTPGPWTVEQYNDDTGHAVIQTVERGHDCPDQGYSVAIVDATGPDDPNALLIAAAPELLDALISMLNLGSAAEIGAQLPALKGLDVEYHLNKARKAIAKATKGL